MDINEIKDDNGKLPTFAWPGGYSMFYFGDDNEVTCPDCANKADEYSFEIVAYDANWEDKHLYCTNCNERIKSAYAED